MQPVESHPGDDVDREERVARRKQRSRSEVHAAALDEITDAMNRVCEAVGGEEDAFLDAAGRHALNCVEW